MMQVRNNPVFFVLLFVLPVLPFGSYAQDVYFSQYYANKPLVNPALTGMRSCPTVHMAYKNQWPELNQAYVTYAAGYDQYFDALHGGVGIYLLRDDLGNASISTTSATGIYAYRAQLSRKWRLNLSLGGAFYNRSYNPGQMIFPDMVASGAATSMENPGLLAENNASYMDFSAGALLYSGNFYAGLSGFHLNQNMPLLESNRKFPLPLRVNAQIGGNFSPGKNALNNFQISPAAIVQLQKDFTRISTGIYLNWEILTIGGWYHQNVHFEPQFYTIMAGFVYKNLRIAYSNDFLLAKTTRKIMPSHEVSLSLELNCIKKKKKWEAISCPDF